MSNLTEVEIFSRMRESLALAAERCDQLAVDSMRGPAYESLRDELETIEKCCRQASAHREDTRWLDIGDLMGTCHKKAGDWLRGYKIDGEWVRPAMGELNQNFVVLAENLRAALKMVDQTQNARTGRVGMIVPAPIQPFMRTDRKHAISMPAHLRISKGGVIIPGGAAA